MQTIRLITAIVMMVLALFLTSGAFAADAHDEDRKALLKVVCERRYEWGWRLESRPDNIEIRWRPIEGRFQRPLAFVLRRPAPSLAAHSIAPVASCASLALG